jgi:hypothetical protein
MRRLTNYAIIIVASEVAALSSLYFNNPRAKLRELPRAEWGGDRVF